MAAAGALPAVTAIELQKKMIKNASLDDFDGDPMKFRLWKPKAIGTQGHSNSRP